MCSHPPSYAHPLPSGRARYGPRPLSLLPQLSLHVTPASQVSATSDKPLALGHRDRSSDSTTTPFCIAVVTDNRARGQDGDDESGVDLSPRDGDLLFLTVRRGSHRTRPGSSYFSLTLNARYSRLACHEGGPEVNCT